LIFVLLFDPGNILVLSKQTKMLIPFGITHALAIYHYMFVVDLRCR